VDPVGVRAAARDISGDDCADAGELGVRAVRVLGLETGFTRMEWSGA
jgi:hypothetical protein